MNVFLDDLQAARSRVGYGRLGVSGRLGYEDQPVVFDNAFVAHAISAHPPSEVVYELHGNYSRLQAVAGFNEDIPPTLKNAATFTVLGDGAVLGEFVVHNGSRADIDLDISSVQVLSLVVKPQRFENCHAIWVNPVLTPARVRPEVNDCLGRVVVDLERSQAAMDVAADRAIVTIASVNFDAWLDGLLRSLRVRGGCQDYPIFAYLIGADAATENVAKKHGVHVLYGRPVTKRDPGLKSAMYSSARLLPKVNSFLCLDADMIVYDNLRPIFDALDAATPHTIAAVRDTVNNSRKLQGALERSYKSSVEEFQSVFGLAPDVLEFPFVVNDGIFAASATALREVDRLIRNWPRANAWTYDGGRVIWRNQFVFNLAMAVLGDVLPLNEAYNVQLHKMQVVWDGDVPYSNSVPAKILHFSGPAKMNSRNRRLPPEA